MREAWTLKEHLDEWLRTHAAARGQGQVLRTVMYAPQSQEARRRAGGRAYGLVGKVLRDVTRDKQHGALASSAGAVEHALGGLHSGRAGVTAASVCGNMEDGRVEHPGSGGLQVVRRVGRPVGLAREPQRLRCVGQGADSPRRGDHFNLERASGEP